MALEVDALVRSIEDEKLEEEEREKVRPSHVFRFRAIANPGYGRRATLSHG